MTDIRKSSEMTPMQGSDHTLDAARRSGVRRLWTMIKWGVGGGAVLGLFAAIFVFIFVVRVTKDLPSLETLAEYKPPVMTRVHAGDGKLISEFSKQARVFVPVETIPEKLQQAFVSAEDKRFYDHNGWDPIGLTRAALTAPMKKIKKQRIGGTSTITQQVAKNFLVGDDYSMTRKIREIAIARRMEKALTKDDIIELYLNEIYFGRGAYGVAAASLKHFGKPMDELSLAQMTYLASVPKGPANYRLDDPDGYKKAKARQSYILGRMAEDGYITAADVETAKTAELDWTQRLEGAEFLAAEYFVEEARKDIYKKYGEDELYSGGLSIRTTLDTQMQLSARKALRRGLEMYDRRHGYRGPLGHMDDFSDWKQKLAAFDAPKDIGQWRVALVKSAKGDEATLGFVPADEDDDRPMEGRLSAKDMGWAFGVDDKDVKVPITQILTAGDIILVEVKAKTEIEYNLRQVPEANGGLIAMDPHTGRVLALVGGYSFDQSQFNRATQAYRQPGSAFKPFVYAAALDRGYTPASQVLDAPFVIERQDALCVEEELDENGNPIIVDELDALPLRGTAVQEAGAVEDTEDAEECEKFYKPSNYNEGAWYGLSTLRLGLEKSRNAMTVRLANDIGMRPIQHYGKAFGIYDDVKPELAWSLGAGETTLLRLASAYSTLVNGGKSVTPTLLDRVQDGKGKTVFVHNDDICEACAVDEWQGQAPPELPDMRETVVDPVTAYQVTFMLKGVVDNGTGRSISVLNRPLGGKTGTTNDYRDAWFMGFSPDLVAGVYVGYDTPRPLNNEAGGKAAAPIFRDFMREALKDKPVVPFRIPEGVTLSPVNRDTGEPSFIGAPNFILEAFRPGSEPRLGDLASTIRVGGGSDTFIGGGFNYGGDQDEDISDLDFSEEDTIDADATDNTDQTVGTDEAAGADSEDAVNPSLDKAVKEAAEGDDFTDEKEDAGQSELKLKTPVGEAVMADNKVAISTSDASETADVEGAVLPNVQSQLDLPAKPSDAVASKADDDAEEDDIDDGLY